MGRDRPCLRSDGDGRSGGVVREPRARRCREGSARAGHPRGGDGARLRDARRFADACSRLLRAGGACARRRAVLPDMAGAPVGWSRSVLARTGADARGTHTRSAARAGRRRRRRTRAPRGRARDRHRAAHRRIVAQPDPADYELEEFEDALVDGDVPYARGTAQAALRNRNFRIMYFGTFFSNIGTWMQNVVLGAFAYKLTKNGAFVSLLYFGQLGPLLFLSLWGGVRAGSVGGRRLLVGARVAQGVLWLGWAAVAFAAHPPPPAMTILVFAIGIANALGAPGLSAILPTLAPREDMPGAV